MTDIQKRIVIKLKDIPEPTCEFQVGDLVRVVRPLMGPSKNQRYTAAHYYAYSQKLILKVEKILVENEQTLVELLFSEPIIVLQEDSTWGESRGIKINPEFLEKEFTV